MPAQHRLDVSPARRTMHLRLAPPLRVRLNRYATCGRIDVLARHYRRGYFIEPPLTVNLAFESPARSNG